MEINYALNAFAALAQETRLRIIKILIEYGNNGAAAGVISERLKVPHNTLSFHLSHLKQAGLVSAKKDGRSIIYFANTKTIQALIDYLSENCCLNEKDEQSNCEIKKEGFC